jgi:hypothetical protein
MKLLNLIGKHDDVAGLPVNPESLHRKTGIDGALDGLGDVTLFE